MPPILLVNDDGIDSPLLQVLVSSFQRLGDVVVAAPRQEQSWVSKRMSRFETLQVAKREDLPYPAYAISGSPADCVNLAIGHLLAQPPAAVVSGINVGHNAGLTYILSSGTIGAALEGALHAIPSFAASMALDRNDYDRLKDEPQALGRKLQAKVQQAAELFATFVEETLALQGTVYGVVHSLNFPSSPNENPKITLSNPALTQASSFFENNDQSYSFIYRELAENEPNSPTDRETLKSGDISYTKLDFSTLGRNL